VGVFVGLFGFTPYIVFNYNRKFPTIIVVLPRVAKKSVDKVKKLKIDRTGESEKQKTKKTARC
jgi:hypothetical protein